DQYATFQFRTYAPTGDSRRGLGNHHVSLEPAFLFFRSFNDRLALEGELRYWLPVGGTDFAGDIIRYGIGVHYDLTRTERLCFTPVLELVGWTVLSGKESVVNSTGVTGIQDAAGDTILNIKVGLRVKLGTLGDFYTGYGRPLTGDRWYENTFRAEF